MIDGFVLKSGLSIPLATESIQILPLQVVFICNKIFLKD